ncbi:hypothetical protein Cni_G01327 [Canna indica]|uniref:Uncharacterized protein n=1 Tax=Canna indica TaxID=4628 RepID=A0AAQ3JPH4_9LILI|nr:hypothetical protein Cni_G01327 [Canna indica]
MAEDPERMAALKRAYADIILNTAKESAGRILASERKVIQLQRSLSLSKEESLEMLLRLKVIMDTKIKESEKANLSQVRKIQELEAQLSEANVMIDGLRSEVRRLNSELDHKGDTQAEFRDGNSSANDATPEKCNAQGNIDNSDSHPHSLSGPRIKQKSDCCFIKDQTRDEPLKNLMAPDNYAGNPDLACLILSTKEPELCRNGCTQRIRAFEQNSVAKDHPAQIHDQLSSIKSETIMHENEKVERILARNFVMAEKGIRRRNRRRRKFITWSSKRGTHHDVKHNGLLDSNDPKVEQDDQDGSVDMRNVVPSKMLKSCSSELSEEDHTTEVQRVNNDKCSELLNSYRMTTRRSVLKLCNSCCENHAGKSHNPSIGTACQENSLKESVAVGTSETINYTLPDMDAKDSTQIGQEMSMKPDHKSAEDPNNFVTKKDETTNVPQDGYKDESCRTSLPADEAGSDKVLKYTFQRKRKRGSLDTKVESTSLEENEMFRRKVDKDNGENVSKRKQDQDSTLLETKKSSSLMVESSRDSRRMAQVARQVSEIPFYLFREYLWKTKTLTIKNMQLVW